MDEGSANQGENYDENINDANAGENSGQRTQSQSSGPVPSFDIAAFTVSFPPGPEPDELISDNEDTEDQEEKKPVCCLCFHHNRKLYAIPPQNRGSFQELLKNVTNVQDGGQGEAVPHRVCWECNVTLTSLTAFRTRAIQTNSLLYSLIRPFINVSEQSTSAPEGSGIPATPRCRHRHHGSRTQPSDENNPGRPGRLSFCVLQRSRPQPQGQE